MHAMYYSYGVPNLGGATDRSDRSVGSLASSRSMRSNRTGDDDDDQLMRRYGRGVSPPSRHQTVASMPIGLRPVTSKLGATSVASLVAADAKELLSRDLNGGNRRKQHDLMSFSDPMAQIWASAGMRRPERGQPGLW